jgi:hypothetical protein
MIQAEQSLFLRRFFMKREQSSIDSIKKKWEESTTQIEYLKSALQGEKVRNNLLELYSAHSYGERIMWHDLALFREAGPIAIIAGNPPHTFFDLKEERLRARIFSLIRKLPYTSLADFREFVILTARLVERISFLCTMTTIQFLEREKGHKRESDDIRVYTDYFTNKLFWETEVLYDLRDEKNMKDFCAKYEEWLCDKVLTEEVVG